MAGAIILQISHGYTVAEGTDPFVTLADEATEQFSYSTAPGGFLVNLVPPRTPPIPKCLIFVAELVLLVASLPDWFPGTGFKQTAKEWAKTLDETASYPFRFVKEQMVCSFRRLFSIIVLIMYQASGTAEKSFVSALLEEPVSPEEENDIKWSAASLYTGMYI